MKRIFWLVPILSSCSGIHFSIEQSGEAVIEGSLLGELLGTFDFGSLDDFEVSVDQKLADQGVEPGDLTALHLTALTLSTPDGELDFLESLEITAQATGIPETGLANGEGFSGTQAALSLEEVDLVDMVVAGGMHFAANAVGAPPAQDTTLKLQVQAEGWATVRGAARQAGKE